MRRFVALPVPAEVRTALASAVAPLQTGDDDPLRWTRPEGWHLTLAFLGSVDDELVPAIVEVVRDVLGRGPQPPQRLQLAAAGRFGRRVLWAGVHDEPRGSVAQLGAAIQRALADRDLPVQQQQVRPHVTLARARRRHDRAVTDEVVARVRVPDRAWTVRHVELWRSLLGGPGPARYEADASLPLAT